MSRRMSPSARCPRVRQGWRILTHCVRNAISIDPVVYCFFRGSGRGHESSTNTGDRAHIFSRHGCIFELWLMWDDPPTLGRHSSPHPSQKDGTNLTPSRLVLAARTLCRRIRPQSFWRSEACDLSAVLHLEPKAGQARGVL